MAIKKKKPDKQQFTTHTIKRKDCARRSLIKLLMISNAPEGLADTSHMLNFGIIV